MQRVHLIEASFPTSICHQLKDMQSEEGGMRSTECTQFKWKEKLSACAKLRLCRENEEIEGGNRANGKNNRVCMATLMKQTNYKRSKHQ